MSAEKIIADIANGKKLKLEEASELFGLIMSGELDEVQIAACLIGMKVRGETGEEIAGAAKAMNEHKIKFNTNGIAGVDTCGTGGDGKSTVNISTAVSLVLASMNIPVVKHGNVAMSGKVGSADILKLLNIPVEFEPSEAEKYYQRHGFVFLFAQKFHPAMRFAGPVRKKLKVPTIFNMLGPLANPADPSAQIIGISTREKLSVLADAVKILKRENVTLYSSRDEFDEVSSKEITDCYNISDGVIKHYTINPADYFKPFEMPVVNTNTEAVEMFMASITGSDENLAKLISINCALALYNSGRADDLKKGYEMSMSTIIDGDTADKIGRMAEC